MASITFNVNGKSKTVETDPDRPLLDVLREDLHRMATHYGCGEGACGACSVLIDGKRQVSCSTLMSEVAGKSVVTIEGLCEGEKLHPLQQAFLAENAFQCGYCTSGMIMCAASLLKSNPHPDDAQIVQAMSTQICRCCTYPRIFNAVKSATMAHV